MPQTYTDDEYFKVIVLSKDEESAINNSRWLTDNFKKLIRTDIIRCEYKKTSIICYPRWLSRGIPSTTLSFEALVVFNDDMSLNAEFLEEIHSFSEISAKLLVTNDSNVGKELNLEFIEKKDRLAVLTRLHELDAEEYERIENSFRKFDDDNSGSIGKGEMKKLVDSLGEKVDPEIIKAALLAFDVNNDGKISMKEFLCWWKLGRKDSLAFEKFYNLNVYLNKLMPTIFSEKIFNNEISKTSKLSVADINLNTLNIEEYATRCNFRLCIGGKAREEACKNYLSRYNDKMEFNNDYFINIAIFVQSCTIDAEAAREYVENFKNELIDIVDRTFIPGLKSFIDNFLIVKVYTQEYSVNIQFEFKYDIQELLKTSLQSYLALSSWISNDGKNPLDLDLRFFSGKLLSDLIDTTYSDFLDKCELKVKFSGLRDKINLFSQNMNSEYSDYSKYLKFLVAASSLKLKYEGPINDYTDSKSKEILNSKPKILTYIVDIVKKNISPELRKVMNRVELGMNIIDTFASFQLFSENQWE